MDAGGVMAQQAGVNCKRRSSMFFTPPNIIKLMKSGDMIWTGMQCVLGR
jgi:hypothetical protein